MQQLNITPIAIVSPVTGAVLAEESFGGVTANPVAVRYRPLMAQFLPYLAMHIQEEQKEGAKLAAEITEMSKNPDIEVNPVLQTSLMDLLSRLTKLHQTSGLYIGSIDRVYFDGEVVGVNVTIKSPILTTSVTCECEKEGTHASVAPKVVSLDANFTPLTVNRFSDH